jgi:hypothetical protein
LYRFEIFSLILQAKHKVEGVQEYGVEEYSGIRGRKIQERGENCIIRNIVLCSPYQILLG